MEKKNELCTVKLWQMTWILSRNNYTGQEGAILKDSYPLTCFFTSQFFAKLRLLLMSNPHWGIRFLFKSVMGKRLWKPPTLFFQIFSFQGKRPAQLYLFWNVKSEKSNFSIHDTQLLLPSDCSRAQRINISLSLDRRTGVWMLLVLPFRSTCVCVFF